MIKMCHFPPAVFLMLESPLSSQIRQELLHLPVNICVTGLQAFCLFYMIHFALCKKNLSAD